MSGCDHADVAYSWHDHSDRLPQTDGWMHSGVAVTADGTIYCAHPDGHALVELAPNAPARTVPLALAELHGIALSGIDGVLAVTDPGYRMTHLADGHYREDFTTGHAAFIDARDGRTVVEFAQPAIPPYATEGWRPTDIAAAITSDGAHEVWIADGYGQNLVHRYTADGRHLGSFDGAETGRSFDCPHGILLRTVDDETEVVVADRSNHRLVRMTLDGVVTGEFGEADLDSPSSLTMLNGHLFVSELFGGIAEFDEHDRFVRTLESARARSYDEPAWPNRPGADSDALAAPTLSAGQFNSPHGLTAHAGALYLTEWFIGGRLTTITPV